MEIQRLQQMGIIQIKGNTVSLYSTCIKVHPDEMGALKKVEPSPSGEHKAKRMKRRLWRQRLAIHL